MSAFCDLTIELPKYEKVQKGRIILFERADYLHK